MECFETSDFDNNSRLITLFAIIISGLHCIYFLARVARMERGGVCLKTVKSLNGKDVVEDLDMDGSAIRGWNRLGDRS
jgi:hypothetical protein